MTSANKKKSIKEELDTGLDMNLDPVAIAKNAFISNISHEIRTPMNAIMGFAQMLKSTELNPQQSDYLDVILDSGKKLLLLIGNLLDLSNLQMGKTNLHPVDCDLDKMIDRIWAQFRPLIAEKNLKPILDVQHDLPIAIVDEEKLERLLSFILTNAIKFTETGSVTLRIRLMDMSSEYPWLDIEVEDTGCGIEPDRLRYIFQVFEQADNSITRSYPGLGLGLGLSGKIVELLGGEISATSTVNIGSCFHLKIPVELH
ncbi:MAG: ATP-binding protein [Candidatus Cloacimonetes bacterium]|jgi:signal transduction histidine kinase|nr:ATP-binding protein [Candidatus Cloacimonadota bacterium]MDD2506377.1 ATP-binding protein [Candidatus Cloacimonadota bacterium]MDD4147753.1 ATP-binding protein [Candidatus Cloacimonadota bacterium]MDD4560055.1 ATP-binding protein [Candidatus Cloacimonadota bacterium]